MARSDFVIEYLHWDEDNEYKFDDHGLSVDDVEEMIFDDAPMYLPNKRTHPHGRIRYIGTNRQGRLMVAILERMPARGEWRPVTGWWAGDSSFEAAQYSNWRGRRR